MFTGIDRQSSYIVFVNAACVLYQPNFDAVCVPLHYMLFLFNCLFISVLFHNFAVVLWQIVTRQLPFAHYQFNYEVVDAVRSGERPAVPNVCAGMLKGLIQECWHSERPSFQNIENRLLEMQTP